MKSKDKTEYQLGAQDVSIEAIKTQYQGFFKIDEYTIKHRLFNGEMSETFTREIFERGDAVVLLPYDPVNDTVVLQEQFRPGALRENQSPWLLECVAGMFGEGESPVEVGVREALEEANLVIEEKFVEPIMEYFSSPGGTTERIFLYVGKVDSTGAGGVYGLPEEHEDIRVSVMSREQALTLLAQGKITNASTIISLQWLAMNHRQLQEKWQVA
ncbi:ADP-ribose diphosphatase [Thalassotalea sp. PLHSN55]|uniref:ADP-ribose diphosphatase n=1 Tax=Thalassotalea sp. PLHSN55 TaxID=3435888 RepID=UPI003F86F7FF